MLDKHFSISQMVVNSVLLYLTTQDRLVSLQMTRITMNVKENFGY